MSLYKQFKTDDNIETTGVLLEFGTTERDGKDVPVRIRIARAGGANQKFNKTIERLMKPYRRQIQTETIDRKLLERLMHEAFATAVVLSWENVELPVLGPNGDVVMEGDSPKMEFVDYSIENCKRLFSDLPDLFDEVKSHADKVALFRADIREDDAGN